MKKLNIGLLLLVFIVALSAVGLSGCQYGSGESQTKTENIAQSKVIVYAGEEGKSAYDILKSKYQLEADETGSMGVIVKSINGLASTDKEFWLYSVNGTPAEVAADKYITRSSDEIRWEYKGM